MRIRFAPAIVFLASCLISQAAPITFPSGYVPFDFIDYVTTPNSNGYSLIVGETTRSGGLMQLVEYLRSLPAVSGNQWYANQPIELAPGRLFNNVIVPTAAEREGNFGAFGPIYDPKTSAPFAGGIVPMSLFGELFAFRVGPADPVSTTPEPATLLPTVFGIVMLVMRLKRARYS